MTGDGERGFPAHVIDAAFGPDALAATHRRAEQRREQPRWLAGLIAKHGEPVTYQPEPITLGASRFQTWAWVGLGVQVEQTLTTWTVSAHRRGRLAKLAGLKDYPTDAEISGVVALAGLDDAPAPVAAQSQLEINWTLINDLATKPHPLLNIGGTCHDCPHWTGEVLQEARNVHHLLDLIKIPHGKGYANNIDARTYLAVRQILALRERLDRIQSWHSRETAEAGMVGDFCNECGEAWPCDTRRMADGTYGDSAADVPIEDDPIAAPAVLNCPTCGSGDHEYHSDGAR